MKAKKKVNLKLCEPKTKTTGYTRTNYGEIRERTKRLWELLLEQMSEEHLVTIVRKARAEDLIKNFGLEGLGDNPMAVVKALRQHALMIKAGIK